MTWDASSPVVLYTLSITIFILRDGLMTMSTGKTGLCGMNRGVMWILTREQYIEEIRFVNTVVVRVVKVIH